MATLAGALSARIAIVNPNNGDLEMKRFDAEGNQMFRGDMSPVEREWVAKIKLLAKAVGCGRLPERLVRSSIMSDIRGCKKFRHDIDAFIAAGGKPRVFLLEPGPVTKKRPVGQDLEFWRAMEEECRRVLQSDVYYEALYIALGHDISYVEQFGNRPHPIANAIATVFWPMILGGLRRSPVV